MLFKLIMLLISTMIISLRSCNLKHKNIIIWDAIIKDRDATLKDRDAPKMYQRYYPKEEMSKTYFSKTKTWKTAFQRQRCQRCFGRFPDVPNERTKPWRSCQTFQAQKPNPEILRKNPVEPRHILAAAQQNNQTTNLWRVTKTQQNPEQNLEEQRNLKFLVFYTQISTTNWTEPQTRQKTLRKHPVELRRTPPTAQTNQNE